MILVSSLLLALQGCAWWAPVPAAAISKLPVVRVGDKLPPTGEYVVFFPAAAPVPLQLKVSGALFATPGLVESQVVLAHDLYLYKYWASRDGKSWQPSHAMLDVALTGGFGAAGLNASLQIEPR